MPATKPYTQPIEIAYGEDHIKTLKFYEDGSAYDLTGVGEITATFRSGPGRSATELFALTIGSGITVTDAAGGEAQWLITEAQNEANFSVGAIVYYDVYITTSAGFKRQTVRSSPADILESCGDV
jgi:hypothetical protein